MELDALTRLLARRQPGLMDATGRYAVLVPMAVSYTHLDVYKRQPCSCSYPIC